MHRLIIHILISLLFFNPSLVFAAQLALVIDDFGYRQHNEEQIIKLSTDITVAVLPHSPNAKRIANMAHEQGNDVIIHLPMAPMGKQPLEKDTLFPTMSETEINRIVNNAIERVPHAIGVNNHMGSLMTSNLNGMQYVMKALSPHSMFFLDSKTIGKTAVKTAASGYNIPVVVRDVFLDDQQNEHAISQQFELAIQVARKKGVAIAIGHPHPQTLNVLKNRLAQLPSDITLIKVSKLVTPQPEPIKPKATLKEIMDRYKQRCDQVWHFYHTENE